MPRRTRSSPVILVAALASAAASAALLAAPAGAQDRDADGISDELELMGSPDQPLLDFPAYGADPDVPDVFVQMDWVGCDPTVDYCGPNASLDRYRPTSRALVALTDYFGPDVRVHIDSGLDPTDPNLATVHGAWGGARRSAQPCVAALGPRTGYFHRGHANAAGGGGGGDLYGYCFGGDGVNMGVLAQELGHNFGMDHGGNAGSYPTNCKPHYRSPMNYAYTYDAQVTTFSRKAFEVVLDPTAMDEQLGLGTTDPVVLATLRAAPWELSVRSDGAIDWNRDGIFQVEPVRAAPTWAWASCEQSTRHNDGFREATQPTTAWLAGPTPRLLLISIRPADRAPTVRSVTRFDLCDLAVEGVSCMDWLPGESEPAEAIAGAPVALGAPAAVAWDDAGGAGHVAVVYAGEDGRLVLLDASAGDGGAPIVWSAPVVLESGALSGPPVAVAGDAPGEIVVYAPVDGTLHRFRVDAAAGQVVAAEAQRWTSGAPVEPCTGAGVARGFIGGRDGVQELAAIPTGLGCRLEIGLREPDGRWAPQSHATIWKTATAPFAGGHPSVAYVPFDRAVPELGRWYVTWKPFPSGAGLIAFTQGNSGDPNDAARRLVFHRGTFVHNVWAIALDGVVVAYDARFDENPRATWGLPGDAINFSPFADGILKVEMKDQDDYAFIRANLACSLTQSCSP